MNDIIYNKYFLYIMSCLYQRKIQNIDQIKSNYNNFILPKILSSECLGVNLWGWLDFEDYLKKPENYNNISLLDDLSKFLKIDIINNENNNTNIIKLNFDISTIEVDIRLFTPNFNKLIEILGLNNNTKIQILVKNPTEKLFWIEGDINNNDKNSYTSTLKNMDLITGDNENNKVEIRNYKHIKDCNIGKNVVFNWFSLEYYSLPKIMKKHNYNMLDTMKDIITNIKRKVNSKTVKFLDDSSGILIWYNHSFNSDIISAFDKMFMDDNQMKELNKLNNPFNLFFK